MIRLVGAEGKSFVGFGVDSGGRRRDVCFEGRVGEVANLRLILQ